ncbi:MAG: right-handed parallel beta-helix repeat-containing protein [Bacteroidales bacterium]|nr:right-handed parallel beta-helix repeat-containing protein [Bacteroidales bacterium]
MNHRCSFKKKKLLNFVKALIISYVLLFFSCKKENFYTGNDAKLNFSTDTVHFDTVFTTIGSATQYLIVYNTMNKPIKISSIRLAKANQSFFRININGISTRELKNVELDAKDSLFIFIEVKIDPTNQNNPIVVQDSIEFHLNGNMQDVDLVAYGQDVHLVNAQIINQNTTWQADKPYLIYNSMLVDSNITLTIEAGATLYFHHKSRMYIKGTLIANGTMQNPIIFRGDRLEEWYNKIPGQWDGIYFVMGSKDNIMNYCEIRNAIIGIQVDTLASLNQPTLTISNSRILNMNVAGIFAQGSTIKAWNCIIANCGQFAIALTIGGAYEFYHCTIINNWYYTNRQTPSVFINNYYQDIHGNIQVRPLEKANFSNCIIYGNKETEVWIDKYPQSPMFNFEFKHTLIKAGNELNTSNTNEWINIFKNQNPGLVDPANEKFELNTNSFCIDKGDVATGAQYPFDIKGNNRMLDLKPDLGAIEWQQP